MLQFFVGVITGRRRLLQPPVDSMDGIWTEEEQAGVAQMLGCSFIGSPETIKEDIQAFINQTKVDEVMVTSHIYDHQARIHSYELFADVIKTIKSPVLTGQSSN